MQMSKMFGHLIVLHTGKEGSLNFCYRGVECEDFNRKDFIFYMPKNCSPLSKKGISSRGYSGKDLALPFPDSKGLQYVFEIVFIKQRT